MSFAVTPKDLEKFCHVIDCQNWEIDKLKETCRNNGSQLVQVQDAECETVCIAPLEIANLIAKLLNASNVVDADYRSPISSKMTLLNKEHPFSEDRIKLLQDYFEECCQSLHVGLSYKGYPVQISEKTEPRYYVGMHLVLTEDEDITKDRIMKFIQGIEYGLSKYDNTRHKPIRLIPWRDIVLSDIRTVLDTPFYFLDSTETLLAGVGTYPENGLDFLYFHVAIDVS